MLSLHITTKDTLLSSEGSRLHVQNKSIDTHYSWRFIKSLYIGPQISLDSTLILKCFALEIPIYFCREKGRIIGSSYAPGYGIGAGTVLKQLKISQSPQAHDLAAEWIKKKQERRASLLTRINHSYSLSIPSIKSATKVFSTEGVHDAKYWKLYLSALSTGIQTKRIKRSPNDIYNASLNYLYGMLYFLVEKVIIKNHLDPYIGFHHSMGKKQKAFLFDVIEPYRPFCEEILWQNRDKIPLTESPQEGTLELALRKELANAFAYYIYQGKEKRIKRIKILSEEIKNIAKRIEDYA